MGNDNDFQEEYQKLNHEAAKYNRQEFDLVYEIISEMVKGLDDVGDNGNFAIPIVHGEIIDEAIKRAGFSKDEDFIADFKHYRDIEQKARNLQLQALEQAIKNMGNNRSFDDAIQKSSFIKNDELQGTMDNVISKGKNENPYFPLQAPFDEETKEDERLDQLFGSKGYNITGAWLRPYFDELKRYKVDDLLNEIGFPAIDLFMLIKKVGDDIENNSDKSIMLDNNILDVLKKFDEYPGRGQVIQLLFLLGIIKWFEGCDINEGDKGYVEAKSLLDTIVSRFIKIYVIYSYYFHKDEHSKPLDEFLANDKTVTPFRLAMRERNMSNGSDKAEVLDPKHSNYYEIKDYKKIQAIFDLCNEEFFECDFVTFRESIEKADFSKIDIKRQNITQDLIYRLSGIFDKDWLREVENNMGWKRGICSGRNDKVKEYTEIKRLDKLISRPIKNAD